MELQVELLKKLISIPSFSREESATADAIEQHLSDAGIACNRYLHNVWAVNKYFSPGKKTLLLNSHHDTVKPNPGYSRDPHSPDIVEGKLYGLGSNDAGGALVALIGAFMEAYHREDLAVNLVLAATAEEEISG